MFGVVYKNKQARRYGYACAGHARRDVKIRTDNRWIMFDRRQCRWRVWMQDIGR